MSWQVAEEQAISLPSYPWQSKKTDFLQYLKGGPCFFLLVFFFNMGASLLCKSI